MLKNLCPNFAPVPYVHYLRFSCLLPNDCATTFLTINEKLFEWLAQTRRLIRNQNGILSLAFAQKTKIIFRQRFYEPIDVSMY